MENSVSMTWTEEVEAGSSDNVSYRERWGGTDEALLVLLTSCFVAWWLETPDILF